MTVLFQITVSCFFNLILSPPSLFRCDSPAGNGSREDLLRACARVIPEGMREAIIGSQSLVIADDLRAGPIDRSINRGIPAPRGHAHIREECRPMIDGLRQVDIDQLMRRVK